MEMERCSDLGGQPIGRRFHDELSDQREFFSCDVETEQGRRGGELEMGEELGVGQR